ncbi:DUF4097 family beta strand repeat-containing protein [Wenjunlia tyrosinilytica]|uniref:Lipoprotein n=1 Tax=Wenjunlia tyrosinilytica TaxID=1544741 RepID=A0A917ZCM7_9ACTN|nr:DUF4097 family beta strand repeat-containing protein [Wenjunlia tyrosinilytica]GGO80440.1 lipoprotein [Wenjunlia tyrosinilytica]
MATPRHLIRTLLGAGGALLVLTAVTGCSDASDDGKPEKRGFALSGKVLTVDADDSDVVIKPADVGKVEVTRWFDAWSVLGSTPKAKWSMKGSTLRLDVDCGPAVVQNCDARHEVLVPRGVAVTVRGDNGKVTASGFDTPLKITADNGEVIVRGASGKLTLTSDNGEVRASGIRSSHVSAGSDNGEVDLRFAKVPDSVRANSDNGEVTMALPDAEYKVSTRARDGDVHMGIARDDTSKHVISAESDNGEITLRKAG